MAMPLAASAAEGGLFNQYKAQVQDLLQSFGYAGANTAGDAKPADAVPQAEQDDFEEVGSAEAKGTEVPADALSIITLDNFKKNLYAPVKEGATTPEEWWVFFTGRNKTCGGK